MVIISLGGDIMRLHQLEYFIKTVECGSITKAAQELYLSQPTLTKAVSALETEYKIQLFQRSAKGICLTPEGRDFLEYAKTVIDSSRALEHTFGQEKDLTIPKVSVASQQFDFVYDVLLALYSQNCSEKIQIDLKEDDRGRVADLVENRDADIGILVVTEEDSKIFRSKLQSKDLEMHILDRSTVYVSMGPKSELYDRDAIDVEEAEKFFHILLDTEDSMRRGIRHQDLYKGIDLEHLVCCNTISVCKRFLLETNALLNTPKWVLGLFENTQIRSVPLSKHGKLYPEVNRLVWVKRKREKLNSLEKQFVELLEKHFAI